MPYDKKYRNRQPHNMIKGNDMITFADIINFKYDANDVDADIRHLLKTGEFKPKYADMVRRFMLAEITNCKRTVEDKNNHMTVFLQGTMSEDNLTKTHEEITPILDRLGFEPKIREFWYNYFVHPTHGQQKSTPITTLHNENKSEHLSPFGLVTDPFYTVYTEIHELMHAVQGKYNIVESEQEYLAEHYQLLYQGKSRDEAKAIQYAKNPKLEQIRYNNRAFNEMQANSAATCYMMLSAMRTGDKKIIDYVEQRLLNESASMSGALMYDHLGLAYFEYPATKQIIADIKAGKCEHLMNDKGLLNWPELYKYTKEKVLGMGYSNDDMFMSLTTAKMLKELRDKNPGDKSKFLDIVEQTAPTLPHPHNQIFMDFVDAQRAYKRDTSKELHNFYHRMGAKSRRAKMLEQATEQQVPNIAEYRQIYQQYNQPIIPSTKEM